jgi:hypothetical protein
MDMEVIVKPPSLLRRAAAMTFQLIGWSWIFLCAVGMLYAIGRTFWMLPFWHAVMLLQEEMSPFNVAGTLQRILILLPGLLSLLIARRIAPAPPRL